MKLALGTVQMGTEYGINNMKPSLENSLEILKSAVESGINVFDTAAAYGSSEAVIGCYMGSSNEKRCSIEVITKLCPDVFDGIPVKDYDSVIEKEATKSIAKLKTEYLSGLLFHNAGYVYIDQAMNALIRARRFGYINKVGISVYTADEAMEALKYDIDIIQVPYNIFDRRLDQTNFFIEAKKSGVNIFARSPLLQGLLAMPCDKIPENMSFAVSYISKYNNICEELFLTPIECAIGFTACHKYIDYLLFGVDNTTQLYEIVLAAGKKMDNDKYEYLSKLFINVPERLIRPDFWKTAK